MSEWFSASLVETVAVGDSLLRVSLEVSDEVVSSFHTPGQYHRVRALGADNLFAIASRPGEPLLHYLVRRSAGAAANLASLHAGDAVEVTRAMGPGFPVEHARGRPVVLIGTGTGFAPLRSTLEYAVTHRDLFLSVRALVGLRDQVELPPAGELARWSHAGFMVDFTFSQPLKGQPARSGRVQQHLDLLEVTGCVAFLCGQGEMVAEVTDALTQRGVNAHDIALNFAR